MVVRAAGLEPARLTSADFKSAAATNFAMPAPARIVLRAAARVLVAEHYPRSMSCLDHPASLKRTQAVQPRRSLRERASKKNAAAPGQRQITQSLLSWRHAQRWTTPPESVMQIGTPARLSSFYFSHVRVGLVGQAPGNIVLTGSGKPPPGTPRRQKTAARIQRCASRWPVR